MRKGGRKGEGGREKGREERREGGVTNSVRGGKNGNG